MTVCIAAICERGKAIVVASDRFRWHPTASIESELEDSKFYILADQLALLGAGSSSDVEDVLRHFRSIPGLSSLTVPEIADRFLQSCHACRIAHAEGLHSKRALGMGAKDLRDLVAVATPGSIAVELYNRMINHNFNTTLLVAGIDAEGAHVRGVDDSGNVSHSELGYAGLGTGGTLACVSLARRFYRKTCRLPEALYYVFEVKKTAELTRGVGTSTDISVIRKGKKPLTIGKREFAALESVYDRLAPPPMSKGDTSSIAKSLGM
jgi:20S proteasome alpha/beta subunit